MQMKTVQQINFGSMARHAAVLASVCISQMSFAGTAAVQTVLPKIVSGIGILTPGRSIKCDQAGVVQGKDILFTCSEQLQGSTAINAFQIKFTPAVYYGYKAKIEFNDPGAAPTDERIAAFLKLSQEDIRVAYNSFREFPDADNFSYSFYDGTYDHLQWRQGAVVYNSQQNYGLVYQVSIGKEYDGKSKTLFIYVGVLG